VFAPAGEGGWGALALSLRLDTADLTDGAVVGGRQDTALLGATWFRDNYVRLMVNVAHSEFDDSPLYGDESARSLMARAQIELH
jgi:phosphate-selective porin OprO/OprP